MMRESTDMDLNLAQFVPAVSVVQAHLQPVERGTEKAKRALSAGS